MRRGLPLVCNSRRIRTTLGLSPSFIPLSWQAGTFAEYIKYWLNEHASRRIAPKTLERYREFAAYLIRHLGETLLNDLTTAQIQRVIHTLQDHGGMVTKEHAEGRPLAAKTVRHIGTLLLRPWRKRSVEGPPSDAEQTGTPAEASEEETRSIREKGTQSVACRARSTRYTRSSCWRPIPVVGAASCGHCSGRT